MPASVSKSSRIRPMRTPPACVRYFRRSGNVVSLKGTFVLNFESAGEIGSCDGLRYADEYVFSMELIS